ncbi:hypothetical protein V1514DRAFT_336572 [Lipomyces japonicus]|uniref:uncharacterized protein n=1 Tax=Lipomyces japonicus TaxID=56871 RepID=UPI0034CDB2D3
MAFQNAELPSQIDQHDESNELPNDVISCLKSARFLQLGTSYDDYPHVSLMNYTYIAKGDAEPYESEAIIVMTSDKRTRKFFNITSNPRVSILVHDWVSKQATTSPSHGVSQGLSQFLLSMNQAELSSISATLNGLARIVTNEEEAFFFKQKLLNSNPTEARPFIDADDSAVILVKISSARVADVENNVINWKEPGSEFTPQDSADGGIINDTTSS